MTEAGGYLLAEALGNATQATTDSLVVKTQAANIAGDIYLAIVNYWKGVLEHDAKHPDKKKPDLFQADSNAADAAQAPAQSLEQTEEGVAAQMPQNIANIINAVTDIIGLFSFVAQLQSSQS